MTASCEEDAMSDDVSAELAKVEAWVCDPCLTGAGGECHVPGCSFWMHDAPTGDVAAWLNEQVADAPGDTCSDCTADAMLQAVEQDLKRMGGGNDRIHAAISYVVAARQSIAASGS